MCLCGVGGGGQAGFGGGAHGFCRIHHDAQGTEIYANQLAPQIVRSAHAGNTLLAAARGDLSLDDVLARIGHHAPAWDVAVPTYAEQPEEFARGVAIFGAELASVSEGPQRTR